MATAVIGVTMDTTMNDDTIADLKQFIATTVRQEVGDLRQEINTRFDGLQASIAEALDTTNDDVDERLRGLEARVGRLEHKAA